MNVTYTGWLSPLACAVRLDGLVQHTPSGRIVLRHSGASREVVRQQIERLKDWMLGVGVPVSLPVEHEIVDGMYLRKMLIRAGTLVVGKIHRKACLNIVASGDITVLTEAGCKRVRAGETAASPPGTQKVGLAHADTVFVNVFRTDQSSIEEIEAEIAGESWGALPCL